MKKPKNQQEKDKEMTKKSSEQILKQIANAKQIVNAIGDGISIMDRTFKVLYQNQVGKDMIGDHVGKFCYEAYEKRQGICSGCPVALTFKDGKVQIVQSEIQIDKETRYAEISASPLKDSKGNIIAGIEVVRDITERKRVEELLLKEKNFTGSVINSLPGIFYLFDENGHFLQWNRNLEIVSGYSSEEIEKMNPLDFFSGEEKKLVGEAIQEVFVKGESNVEANFISKDGRTAIQTVGKIIKDSPPVHNSSSA